MDGGERNFAEEKPDAHAPPRPRLMLGVSEARGEGGAACGLPPSPATPVQPREYNSAGTLYCLGNFSVYRKLL